MINNHDLRIGNLMINSEEKICVVSQILADIEKSLEYISLRCTPPGKAVETIKPIPLSAEILFSIGFKKKSFGHTFYYCKESFMLTADFRLCTIHDGASVTIGEPIKFVHRLQNLYYFLFGKEMELAPQDIAIPLES